MTAQQYEMRGPSRGRARSVGADGTRETAVD
jgi:hypothetical protein